MFRSPTGKAKLPGGFTCRLCGRCCRGRGGIVVSGADLLRLCRHLAVSAAEFESAWGFRRGSKLFLRSEKKGDCVFFLKGKGCSVHTVKPAVCRAWPYFRGNLLDGGSLKLAKEYCPGIPRAQTHEDFVREGLAYLLRERLAGDAGADEACALQVNDLLMNRDKAEK